MSHHEEIRSALLKETTGGAYKKVCSVKVSELVEPKVVVERREWPGSEWGVYRVMGTMKGDWDKAVEMVKSVTTDAKMMKMMGGDMTMKVLEKEGEDCAVVYRVDGLPWPLSDREATVHRSFAFADDKTFVYAMRSVPGAKQVKKDNVLADIFIEGFILQKLDGDKIAIWSIGGMDPKGNIPEKLISSFISDSALALGKFQKKLLK